MDRFPYAEHLNSEEVDYELFIRGNLNGEVNELDLAGKQRLLRTLFKTDLKEGRNYRSPCNISDEFDHISGRLADLARSLRSIGIEPRFESRLLHYWYRAKRCRAETEDQKKMRRELVRRIEDCMKENKISMPSTLVKERINDVLNNTELAEGGSLQGKQIHVEGGKNTDNIPKDTGAIPKRPEGLTSTPQVKENTEMETKMNHMERMLSSLMLMVADGGTHSDKKRRGTTFWGNSQQDSSSSSDEDRESRRNERHSRRHLNRLDELGRRDNSESEADEHRAYNYTSSSSCRDSNRHARDIGNRTRHQHRRGHETGRRDQQYRVEKWKLKFTGDSKSISVENFLYKLNKIAQREGVSERQLLRDVHLLLDGPASDWFFTFVDDFDTWKDFERLIKYRFGNPNQDQGIRQKIQERKQQRGESFIAFVTEIEKLNRMLSKPLSKNRKFEVIWDNMRLHYRSKISIVEVKDLQHLMKLNYRIDAADPNLQQTWETQPRRSINNVEIEEESDVEYEEMADINVIKTQQSREPRKREMNLSNPQVRSHATPKMNNPPEREDNNVQPKRTWVCWNCQQEGHSWSVCTRPKVIFCYGCGNLGRTIRSCERCSNGNRPSLNSNQQGNY